MSPKSSSLAFEEIKDNHNSMDCGMVVEPKLNLLVKSALRNSVLKSLSHLDEVASIEGRITVSF